MMTSAVRSGWIGDCSELLYHPVNMEQLMEHLVTVIEKMDAERDSNQAKMDTNVREMKEEMMARLEALIQNNQELMMARLDSNHKRIMARMDSQVEKMEACLEKTETTEEIESNAEHEEVPNEEDAGETFGTLKERYEDQHLAIGCR
jgi:recombination DNA repair RAD52 pathway protein